MPNRLSLVISIKNYADSSANVADSSLLFDPSDQRWNSLILIAGTERISKLEYVSTFQRHGYGTDVSAMEVEILDLPEVVAILELLRFLPRIELGLNLEPLPIC